MFFHESRYQNLLATDRETINAAYKAYYEACSDRDKQKKRVIDTDTLLYIEPSLDRAIKKGYLPIANAWAAFTYYIIQKKEERKSLTENLVKEAFEAYRIGFQDQNFLPYEIPEFNSLLGREKNAYLAAAQTIYQELEPQLQRSNYSMT